MWKQFKLLGTIALAFTLLVGSGLPAKALDTSYHAPIGPGQVYLFQGSDMALPTTTTLGANATATGTLMVTNGIKDLAVSVVSTHTATGVLTTFLDQYGSVTEESVTAAMTANVATVLRTTADHPFLSYQVTITDAAGAAGTAGVRDALGQN